MLGIVMATAIMMVNGDGGDDGDDKDDDDGEGVSDDNSK